MRISLKFEMRAPAFGTPIQQLYAEALNMAEFADEIGVSTINLQEHHGFEDCFMPTPFVMGGGIAARTKRVRINLGAVLLPLHSPVEVAEQLAVLDLMSGGRVEVVLGAGYVPWEYATFQRSMRDRGRLMDEGIEIILRALNGERFQAGGREIYVRPLPVQRPEDFIMVGGSVEAAAKRAARFGLDFQPTTSTLFEVYREECRRLGRTPRRVAGPSKKRALDVHISEDPEADWPKIMPHLQHTVSEYAKIVNPAGTDTPFRGVKTDPESLRQSKLLELLTPEQFLEYAATVEETGSIGMSPLMAGLPPELGWKSLKLLGQLMPRLRDVKSQVSSEEHAA